MFIAQGQPSISAMVPLSITVGVITTSFGIWFSRQKHRPYRGSVLGTLTAGILVGIALLSMLPEAIDQLTECGWHTSTVIFMCIGAGGFIFFLENVVLPHEHITSGGEGPLATGDSAATASPPATASTSTVEVELACVPCEPCEDGAEALPPTLPPKKAAIVWGPPRGGKQAPKPPGTKGGAKGSVGDGLRNGCRKPRPQPMWAKRGSAAFLELDREAMCECCDEAGGSAVVSINDGREAVAEESLTWRMRMATALRQLAWLLHAAIDGMVLAAIPRWGLLPTGTLAVLVCALQDVVAYCIVLARARTTRRRTLLALVLFGLAFPLGTTLASTLLSSLRDSEAVAIVRTLSAAMFLYMASELAPSHTHSRARNALYLSLFTLGLGVSALMEMVEGSVESGATLAQYGAPLGYTAAVTYTLDPNWRPNLPIGAHAFSAVGVAHHGVQAPWDPPPTSIVYVFTARQRLTPLLVHASAHHGALSPQVRLTARQHLAPTSPGAERHRRLPASYLWRRVRGPRQRECHVGGAWTNCRDVQLRVRARGGILCLGTPLRPGFRRPHLHRLRRRRRASLHRGHARPRGQRHRTGPSIRLRGGCRCKHGRCAERRGATVDCVCKRRRRRRREPCREAQRRAEQHRRQCGMGHRPHLPQPALDHIACAFRLATGG